MSAPYKSAPRWRGTSSANKRGNTHDRRRRRAWLWSMFSTGKTIACFWCSKRLRTRWEVDRIVCGHDGGRYVRGNIVPSCRDCNVKKCVGKACRQWHALAMTGIVAAGAHNPPARRRRTA